MDKESEEIDTNIFTVVENLSQKRLDKLLSDRFPEKSRTYFQYLIEENCVCLNGKPVKKRIIPQKGDEIEVFFRLTPEISLEPENIPLDILYEDEHILAVHKPPGMVVHPAAGNPSKTFVNALIYHCKNIASVGSSLRPGIVHRLDKDTSGVLLAAKTETAHRNLITAFSKRKMKKQYLAICEGKPQNGLLQTFIARHPVKRKEMCVAEQGKEAISNIHVLAYNEKKSLVLVEPLTGRTHQIRVHLSHLKAPILGDIVYGKHSSDASRQCLHAYRLSFLHPITKAPMDIVAPLPLDMKKLIQKEFYQKNKNLAQNFP